MAKLYFCVFESVEGAKPAYSFVPEHILEAEKIRDLPTAAVVVEVKNKRYSHDEAVELMKKHYKEGDAGD